VSRLVAFPVAMDVWVTPFIGFGQQVPSLQGAEASVQQTENCDGPVVARAKRLGLFG